MTNNKSTPESLSPLNPLKGTFNRSLIFNDLSAYGGLGVEKLKINDLIFQNTRITGNHKHR